MKYICNYLQSRLMRPDVIICLTGTSDMIYNRVLNRNRDAEKNISFEYIDKISKHYEVFSELKENYCTIEIDMNKNDFIKDPVLIRILRQKLIEKNIIE